MFKKYINREYKGQIIKENVSDYVVIDIETTGFSPTNDYITEIAAIRVRDNKEVDTFESLIKIDIKVPKIITEITGITDDMLKDAPLITDVLTKFLDFIGNDILIGHNVNFDIDFIYDSCIRNLDRPLSNNFIDTLSLARTLLPILTNHKLGTVAESFNIKVNTAHRGLADCKTTMQCYENLIKLAK